MWVSAQVLGIVAATALILALVAPLHFLLFFDLLLAPIKGQTQIGGVLVDHTDVVFAILALGFALRMRLTLREIRSRVPFFWLWLLLGAMLSMVYLAAPMNQQYLTAFHRAVYQVYRASWKPILYFPLAALLLNTRSRSRQALIVIVLIGDISSLFAIPQGYQGYRAWGPFLSANTLGAVLIAPTIISFGKLLLPHTTKEAWFYGVSLILLGRSVLFSGSRGAQSGMLAGAALLLFLIGVRSTGRNRLIRLVPAGLAVVLLVFALKPDVLNRPTVRRLFTLTNPMQEETMQWRMEERWDFYWQKALQQPWLGYGTDVDPSLKERSGAKTPHNSYLSLLVESGFPATTMYLLLIGLSLWRGLTFFRQQPITQSSGLGLLLAAAMVGILTHFMADSIVNVSQVSKTLWLLAGMSACLTPLREGVQRTPSDSPLRSSTGPTRSDVLAPTRAGS